MRQHLPVAQLEASIRNYFGGKADPADSSGKAIDPSKLYSPYELLPWYAKMEQDTQAGIPKEDAREFLANAGKLPSWVISIAPIEAIKAAASHS